MLRNSPLLEIYKKKGIEVLLLDDDIDEILFSNVDKYGDTDLKSVNKSSPDELKDDSAPEHGRRKSRSPQAAAGEDQGSTRRCGKRSSRLLSARGQSLGHRVGRRRAERPHATDDARHGPERDSRTHANP